MIYVTLYTEFNINGRISAPDMFDDTQADFQSGNPLVIGGGINGVVCEI